MAKVKYVIRCRIVQPDGVGYVTKDGGASAKEINAICFDSEAEAWDYAIASNQIGSDEQGDFCWVEELRN